MLKGTAYEKRPGTLGEGVVPTAEQKERIFESVLTEARDHPLRYRIREFITICPWRFAFGAAAVQALTCVLLMGEGYTGLLVPFLEVDMNRFIEALNRPVLAFERENKGSPGCWLL